MGGARACGDAAAGATGGMAGAPCGAATAPVLEAVGLHCGYGGADVVRGVTFSVLAGQVVAVLGPNGAGKTTLFKALLGFIPARAGAVLIMGEDAGGWSRRRFAQAVAYIPQQHTPAFSFSVLEFVLMGRTPSIGAVSAPSARDEELALEALAKLGMEGFAERDYTLLSGGERQMVLVARALAQQARLLVMDEPAASLDYGNQVRLLEQVRALAAGGLSVVMTTHDPNHALMAADSTLCLGAGGSFAFGPTRDVCSRDALEGLYGVPVGMAEARLADGRAVTGCFPVLRAGGTAGFSETGGL